jgi:hypothetical protein
VSNARHVSPASSPRRIPVAAATRHSARFPPELVARAEEAGVVTSSELGVHPIVANLPHPDGVRSMGERQSRQAERMDQLAALAAREDRERERAESS